MRRTACLVLALAFGIAAAASAAQAMPGLLSAPAASEPSEIVKVEYYCSPGFEPRYGRCIATASTDQVDLYLNEPGGYDQDEAPPPVRPRRGLPERY